MNIKTILSYFLAFLSSTLITAIVRAYAIRKSILDIPNARSSHHISVPRGGGIAIVLVFLAFVSYLNMVNHIDRNLSLALIGGGIMIACVGFYDDIYSTKVRFRFLIHLLSSLWVLYYLGGLTVLDFGFLKISLGWYGYLLAIIGIMWCINLYNFMDGIDGLAGSEGMFVAIVCGIALSFFHIHDLANLMWLLVATIGGFIIWNWPPAKIFLGDVGSGFLGFIFAVIGLYTINKSYLPFTFWCVILAVFLYDATFTLLNRIYRGKKWYHAHKEHAYQHLIACGATHKQVTVAIIFLNSFLLFPLASIMLYWPAASFWLFSASVISFWFTWLWIKSQNT